MAGWDSQDTCAIFLDCPLRTRGRNDELQVQECVTPYLLWRRSVETRGVSCYPQWGLPEWKWDHGQCCVQEIEIASCSAECWLHRTCSCTSDNINLVSLTSTLMNIVTATWVCKTRSWIYLPITLELLSSNSVLIVHTGQNKRNISCIKLCSVCRNDLDYFFEI